MLWLSLGCAGLLTAGGCASAGGAQGVYRADLGRAPSQQILAGEAIQVLEGYGFRLQGRSDRLLETEWRIQDPVRTVDRLAGRSTRDRVRITISRRGNDYFVGRLRISFEEFRDGTWHPAEPPEGVEAQYGDIRRAVHSRLSRYMTQN